MGQAGTSRRLTDRLVRFGVLKDLFSFFFLYHGGYSRHFIPSHVVFRGAAFERKTCLTRIFAGYRLVCLNEPFNDGLFLLFGMEEGKLGDSVIGLFSCFGKWECLNESFKREAPRNS